MSLLIDRPEMATVPEAPVAPAAPAAVSQGPVGAPKASYTYEVLRTLRSRLMAQLNDHSGNGSNDPGSPEIKAVRATVERRLDQVNVALTRIQEGKYGICTECVRPIEADRLVILPFATLCTSCQDRIDGTVSRVPLLP